MHNGNLGTGRLMLCPHPQENARGRALRRALHGRAWRCGCSSHQSQFGAPMPTNRAISRISPYLLPARPDTWNHPPIEAAVPQTQAARRSGHARGPSMPAHSHARGRTPNSIRLFGRRGSRACIQQAASSESPNARHGTHPTPMRRGQAGTAPRHSAHEIHQGCPRNEDLTRKVQTTVQYHHSRLWIAR